MPRENQKSITVDEEVYRAQKKSAGEESLNTKLQRMLRLSIQNLLHKPRHRKPRSSVQGKSAVMHMFSA